MKQRKRRPKSKTPKPVVLGEQNLNKSMEKSVSVDRARETSKSSFYTDKRRNTD